MGRTAFIETIVELVEKRRKIKIDFSVCKRCDTVVADSIKTLAKFRHFKLCDKRATDEILFEEGYLFAYFRAEYVATLFDYEILDNDISVIKQIATICGIKLFVLSGCKGNLGFTVIDDDTVAAVNKMDEI